MICCLLFIKKKKNKKVQVHGSRLEAYMSGFFFKVHTHWATQTRLICLNFFLFFYHLIFFLPITFFNFLKLFKRTISLFLLSYLQLKSKFKKITKLNEFYDLGCKFDKLNHEIQVVLICCRFFFLFNCFFQFHLLFF